MHFHGAKEFPAWMLTVHGIRMHLVSYPCLVVDVPLPLTAMDTDSVEPGCRSDACFLTRLDATDWLHSVDKWCLACMIFVHGFRMLPSFYPCLDS